MKRLTLFPILAITAAIVTAGCSSSTEPSSNNSNTDSTKINITSGSYFTFTETRLDTIGGAYGQDNPDPQSVDSVHSTVLSTDANYDGKSGVTIIQNSRTINLSDSTYLWQDDQGNIYSYDFGIDAINDIPGIHEYLGRNIDPGWVLQANVSANGPKTWITAQDTEHVTVPFLGDIEVLISDSASRQADTTIMVAGQAMNTIHTLHKVNASSALGVLATVYVDNYFTTKYGTVRNITHSFSVAQPINFQVSGQDRELVKLP